MATNEEMIKQMYGSNLNSQKEQLKTDYESALSDLDRQQQANQQTTDDNLRRTAVEAQRAQVNNEEYYAASGLSSGARAQARLSQENQLQADMTALRTAQQNADAETERQRGQLARDYESAIRKAQADNDLALAQALYDEAKDQDNKVRTGGDPYNYYTRDESGNTVGANGELYSPDQVKKAQGIIGVGQDGIWGSNSVAMAKAYGYGSIAEVLAGNPNSAIDDGSPIDGDDLPRTYKYNSYGEAIAALSVNGKGGIDGLMKPEVWHGEKGRYNRREQGFAASDAVTLFDSYEEYLEAYVADAALPRKYLDMDDWTLVDDGGPYIGKVDDNAVVMDSHGNQYRLDDLIDKFVEEGMSKEDAKALVIKIQEHVGA